MIKFKKIIRWLVVEAMKHSVFSYFLDLAKSLLGDKGARIWKLLAVSVILIATIYIVNYFKGVLSLLLIVPYLVAKFEHFGINTYVAYAVALPYAMLIIISLTLILSRQNKEKRYGYVLGITLWCSWWLGAFYIHYDYNFDTQSGQAQKCLAATPNGYESQPCERKFHPVYHSKVFPLDGSMAMAREIKSHGKPSLERLEIKCEQVYFSPDGTALAWYYRNAAGKIELFQRPGKHPQFNDDLLPVTKEIVKEICQNEVKSNEAALLELKTKVELSDLKKQVDVLQSENKRLENNLKQGVDNLQSENKRLRADLQKIKRQKRTFANQTKPRVPNPRVSNNKNSRSNKKQQYSNCNSGSWSWDGMEYNTEDENSDNGNSYLPNNYDNWGDTNRQNNIKRYTTDPGCINCASPPSGGS